MDGRSLYGYNNLQAVDLLRSTGKVVKLKLARYMKGSKFESAIEETTDEQTNASSISQFNASRFMNGSTVIQVNNNAFDVNQVQVDTSKSTNDAIEKWAPIVGIQFDIIVSLFKSHVI